jgi:hypothetical protein
LRLLDFDDAFKIPHVGRRRSAVGFSGRSWVQHVLSFIAALITKYLIFAESMGGTTGILQYLKTASWIGNISSSSALHLDRTMVRAAL